MYLIKCARAPNRLKASKIAPKATESKAFLRSIKAAENGLNLVLDMEKNGL